MSTQVGVVVIHGMGSQKPGFSDGLREEVSKRLGTAKSARFVWQEIYWAKVLKDREDTLWERMLSAKDPKGSPIPLDWTSVRKFVVHNFGDALAYHRDAGESSAYQAVHKEISAALTLLYGRVSEKAPLVVLAHSLGAHMFSDYAWDRQNWKRAEPDPLRKVDGLAWIVSFGCNIPLFSLDFDVPTPIDFPGAAIDPKSKLHEIAAWQNFLDRDDVLGWPMRPLYEDGYARLNTSQQATVERIQDQEIDVGSLITSWNPAAHDGYWTDDDFTKPVTGSFERILAALGP